MDGRRRDRQGRDGSGVGGGRWEEVEKRGEERGGEGWHHVGEKQNRKWDDDDERKKKGDDNNSAVYINKNRK